MQRPKINYEAMKSLNYIPFALLGLLAGVSCIEEDLDACPPEGGGVAITVRVEKFRTRPPYDPEELEPSFNSRIHSLRYLLYDERQLIEEGELIQARTADDGSYLFRHDPLPFGAYRLALVANTEPKTMTGTTDAPESRFIVYRDGGDDHFRSYLPFEVTCPCSNEFETVLQRVHGVTRFRFENLPPEISAVEVSLDNVGARIPLNGEPDQPREVVRRVRTADLGTRSEGAFTLGTFSTLPGLKSSWRLKLFAEDQTTPVYERLVTDTLRIERNQLLELTARFNDMQIEFEVDVDSSWDGSNDGGGGEAQ